MIDVADILKHIQHELGGGDLSIELPKYSIINQAGHFLYSMHPWRFATGRSALLDLRGVLSGTAATWTASTSTLTETGAFTDYDFLAGDEITIDDGTGATTGVYKIASKTSANAIVLDGSISATNLSTGDISWRIDPQTIDLPDDLRDIIDIHTANLSSIGGVVLTTLAEVNRKRASAASITASTGIFYGAVNYAGSPPRPLLEIWPSPNSTTTGAMRIFYRSRWAEVSTDSAEIDIPEWMEDLLVQIVRAYAGGYERSNIRSLGDRLEDIMRGPLFATKVRSDGMVQPFHSMIRNGGAQVWRRSHAPMPLLGRVVEAPQI